MSDDKKDQRASHASKGPDASAGPGREGIHRRQLLGATAAGVLALPVVGCSTTSRRARGGAPSAPSGIDPETVVEAWPEPWEWVVRERPGQVLQLHVVEHDAPERVTGERDPDEPPVRLFSYNGITPGPTVRMRGDETLKVKLINGLSGNLGNWAYQNNPTLENISDWQISKMPNSPHQQHTTNLHTHGLHVRPGTNPDGTHADNVLLRLIPYEDYKLREDTGINWPLDKNELVAAADYEFRLGEKGPIHPPGTHWYHPHPHGATYDQVAGGMAGFIIVEGDVDEALRAQIHGYKERLVFFQRVVAPPPQESETPRVGTKQKVTLPAVNGRQAGDAIMVMRPGAIERWRVLNGSVDGQGNIKFMVVEGTLPPMPSKVGFNDPEDKQIAYREAVKRVLDDLDSRPHIELDHLAFDGITLVTPEGTHDTVPVDSLLMAPANRADFLVQAPRLAPGETAKLFTVAAVWVPERSDHLLPPSPQAVAVATLIVRGDEVDPGVERDPATGKLKLDLPPVPKILQPVTDDEITIASGDHAGQWRTRQVRYSGWGNVSYPCAECRDGKKKPCNTMMIDGAKYDGSESVHRMALNTAEEWTLWNYAMGIYTDAGGTVRYGEDVSYDQLEVSAKTQWSQAVDHPFHIHQNPFWVISIQDAEGNELLPGGRPRWQDTVSIPRNGGRVIFRSRFWNYAGAFVDHCHLLQHEDWGMMQRVEVVDDPARANYVPNPPGYRWPAPSKREMYMVNLGGEPLCDQLHPPPPEE